jgi:hypothetical protein
MRATLLGALLALLPAAGYACPVCLTSTGEQVRAGIFGADFARNLVLAVLPFAVVASLLGAVTSLLSRHDTSR